MYAYIGRRLLAALGIGSQKLMNIARDKYGGSVNTEDLERIRSNGLYEKKDAWSIHAIQGRSAADYGSTFHSSCGEENDYLEDDNIYIDLGDDDPSELEAALKNLVIKAAKMDFHA